MQTGDEPTESPDDAPEEVPADHAVSRQLATREADEASIEVDGELVDDDDDGLPACARQPDQVLVNEVARDLKKILRKTVTRGMEEVGGLLLERFFDNRPELYESNSNSKHASLRLLLEKCDSMRVPVSRTFLASCLQMAVFMRQLPPTAEFFRKLPASHRVEVMRLHDVQRAEQIAKEAVENRYAVRRLRQVVAEERANATSTSGRRPKPEILRTLSRLTKQLNDAKANRLRFGKKDLEALSDEQRAEVAKVVEDLVKRAGQLQKLIGG